MPDENRNAGREAAAPADGAPPAVSPEQLAAHLGRELSASAVDGNGWTDLHYAAALDCPATARALLAAGRRSGGCYCDQLYAERGLLDNPPLGSSCCGPRAPARHQPLRGPGLQMPGDTWLERLRW